MRTAAFLLAGVTCDDGVASHCEALIEGLRDNGWRVVIISGPVQYDASSKLRFDRLNEIAAAWIVRERGNMRVPAPGRLRTLLRELKKYDVEVLHAHGFSMLLIARALGWLAKLPVVATFHPSVHIARGAQDAQRSQFANPRRYRSVLRLLPPARFLALSTEIERFLIDACGVPAERVSKILAGVDVDHFRPPTLEERQAARRALRCSDQALVCSIVGRLSWNKGHDLVIDSLRQVRQALAERELRCLIVGGGYQEEEIRDVAHQSQADTELFSFLGFVTDLRQVYWASDLFLLPSRVEGFALVVAEAMCCGAVPIRTPSGGALDQIRDGWNGRLVPFDDADKLAETILELSDAGTLQQMSVNAAEFGRAQFDRSVMARRSAEVYADVTMPGASSGR